MRHHSSRNQRQSRNYRDLVVWQKAIKLVKAVYLLTRQFPKTERFALTDQIRRAAVSVPSNIAEGQGRRSVNEFRHFLRVSLGSLAELDTQLTIGQELGYVGQCELDPIHADIVEVRKMINGLLSSLRE